MIRRYVENDMADVLRLFLLNTPKFFAPSEERPFMDYLDGHAENYYVVEESNEIIGAGGLNYGFDNGTTSKISWDMIHPEAQGKGVGLRLIKFRIKKSRKESHVDEIVVRTSQLAYGFYKKCGFRLERIEEDYWAKGYHLYHMAMDLSSMENKRT